MNIGLVSIKPSNRVKFQTKIIMVMINIINEVIDTIRFEGIVTMTD